MYMVTGKRKMKEVDSGPVDEEGTPDVYTAFMEKLYRVGKLQEELEQPKSMDWRVERMVIAQMIDKTLKQPSYQPRVGELVLWYRDLDGELSFDLQTQELKVWNDERKQYTGFPPWLCGVVTQVPDEEVDLDDLVVEKTKQTAANISGFRVECIPDPNERDKGLSKHYSYVPLCHIRPLTFWAEILRGMPQDDWHPTINNGLSLQANMNVVKPTHFTGTWPSCNLSCKGLFLGAELFWVGDTVRLMPENLYVKVTDVLLIKKIFVKWANLQANPDGTVSDDSAAYNSVHVVGVGYTLDKNRSYKSMLLALDEDTGRYPLGMEGYGPWYLLQRPGVLLDVSYDRVLGRCYDGDAMKLWSASDEPDLNMGLAGVRAGRKYSAETDQRLVLSKKKCFWGDNRAEALDLETFNGIDVGVYDRDRDPRAWREFLSVIDGESSKSEAQPEESVSAKAEQSKSSFTAINSQSSLVASALQQTDDSDASGDVQMADAMTSD